MNHENYSIQVEEWLHSESALALLPYRTKRFIGDRPYRHFDARVPLRELQSNEAEMLLNELRSPAKLSKHRFYPFVRADKKVRRYTSSPQIIDGKRIRTIKIKQKLRPIMYASHSDAVLYGFYAHQLKLLYDAELKKRKLNQTVIAYRKLPRNDSSERNKSNIDFANDIFTAVSLMDNAAVLCLDVSDFFGSMNHRKLEERWSKLIQTEHLPLGHATIFRNITRYRYLFLNDAQVKVGLGSIVKGKFYFKEKIPERRKHGPITLSSREYNKHIRRSSLIKVNGSPKGIPQGSPISDILANLYLIDFDEAIQTTIDTFSHGLYRRYSDDLLIICPQDKMQALYDKIRELLHLEELEINSSKSELFYIDRKLGTLKDMTGMIVKDYLNNKSTIQYLGFEFDLEDIHVRSGTIANHYRKVKRRINRDHEDNPDNGKPKVKRPKKDKYAYLKRASIRIKSLRLSNQFINVRKRTSRLRRNKKDKN